ncbi:MAG TPA: hypothetical protein VK689_19925, partial [Armatimonadota bacterium]|nr:hypothetical protein [Armatimonadota bacterium]
LQFAARNLEGLTTLLHLTYPAVFPRDGEVVKRHWARLREWLADQGLGGLWLLEFQARGAPHFMLFLNGRVDRDAVAARWDRIVGSGDPEHRGTGTRVERTRKPYAAAAYAVKFCEKHAQKQVPADYRSVGRMWGTFGGVRVRPHETLAGPTDQMAPAVRTLRKLEDARRRKQGWRRHRDNGVAGWTGYDRAPAALWCLERLGLLGETAAGEAAPTEAVSAEAGGSVSHREDETVDREREEPGDNSAPPHAADSALLLLLPSRFHIWMLATYPEALPSLHLFHHPRWGWTSSWTLAPGGARPPPERPSRGTPRRRLPRPCRQARDPPPRAESVTQTTGFRGHVNPMWTPSRCHVDRDSTPSRPRLERTSVTSWNRVPAHV